MGLSLIVWNTEATGDVAIAQAASEKGPPTGSSEFLEQITTDLTVNPSYSFFGAFREEVAQIIGMELYDDEHVPTEWEDLDALMTHEDNDGWLAVDEVLAVAKGLARLRTDLDDKFHNLADFFIEAGRREPPHIIQFC